MIGPPVSTNISAPPLEGLTTIFDYSGSTLIYKGWAKSDQVSPIQMPSVTSFTAASPGIMTFASVHGFNWDGTNPTAQPVIAISGGTGNWAAANGIWIFQPTSTTAGSLASIVAGSLTQLNTSTFGAVTGTLLVYTRSPRTFDNVWAIQKLVYNATPALEWSGFPANPPGAGSGDPSKLIAGGPSFSFAWSSRASYAYQ